MKQRRGIINIQRGAVIMICLVASVGGYVIYERTLVEWWKPIAAATVLSLFLSPLTFPLSKFVTAMQSRWINTVCSLIIAGTLSYFALLGCNYWWANEASECEETVTVIEKQRSEHQRYRRVGRNRMAPTGEHYYSYSVVVKFSDGTIKEIKLPQSAYSRTRINSTLTYRVSEGGLGFKVIK